MYDLGKGSWKDVPVEPVGSALSAFTLLIKWHAGEKLQTLHAGITDIPTS